MQISPHLVVHDAAAAAAFYADAFSARETRRLAVPDGRLMSLTLLFAGTVEVHVADEFPELDVIGPRTLGGSPVVLALLVPEAEPVFARAVAAGGSVTQPLAEAFWGDLHGQVEDPFGHRWNIDQHLRDVSEDEMAAAVASLFG